MGTKRTVALLLTTFALDLASVVAFWIIAGDEAHAQDKALIGLLIRIGLVVLGGFSAVAVVRARSSSQQQQQEQARSVSISLPRQEPLLATVAEDEESPHADIPTSYRDFGGAEPGSQVEATPSESNNERAAKLEAAFQEQQDAVRRQEKWAKLCNIATVLVFIGMSGTMAVSVFCMILPTKGQGGTSKKDDHPSFVESVRIGVFAWAIVAANLESSLARSVIANVTKRDVVHVPELHEHALVWESITGYVHCTICDEKIGERTGGMVSLTCETCGAFTCCTNCYKKFRVAQSDAAGAAMPPGLLVTDKGQKASLPMTPMGFVVRMAHLMKPMASLAILTLFCTAATSVIGAGLLPKAAGEMLDTLSGGIKSDSARFADKATRFGSLVLLAVMFGSIQAYTTSVMVQSLYNVMARSLYKSLLNQDVAFYDNAMSGQLTARLTNDLGQCTFPIPQLLSSVFANVIAIMAGLATCLATSWRMTALAMVVLIPMVFITDKYAKFSGMLTLLVYSHIGDATGLATQSLVNIRTVKSSGAIEIEEQKYSDVMNRQLRDGTISGIATAINSLLVESIQSGAGVLVMVYGGYQVLFQGYPAGIIYTFIMLWQSLQAAFKGLTDNLAAPVKAKTAAERIFELIDLEPDIRNISDAPPVPDAISITFKDVCFNYLSRKELVFNKLNLRIDGGCTAAFVGKSGCGKSTITRLLLRFYDAKEGQILLNGRRLDTYSVKEFRRCIGLVSQETQLFKCSIRDNLTYGLEDGDYSRGELKDELEKNTKLAMAHDFILTQPQGYNTTIAEGASDLSGGQRQRLSIARALLRKPRLLILDEATSALDSTNEQLVMEALATVVEEMRGNCTVVSIAHRLASFKDADKIFVLNNDDQTGAHVVEEGTHDEMVAADGPYKALVAPQLVTAGPTRKSLADSTGSIAVAEKNLDVDISEPCKKLFENCKGRADACDLVMIAFNPYKSADIMDDMVMVLRDSEVVEQGTHEELTDVEGRYQRMMSNIASLNAPVRHGTHAKGEEFLAAARTGNYDRLVPSLTPAAAALSLTAKSTVRQTMGDGKAQSMMATTMAERKRTNSFGSR